MVDTYRIKLDRISSATRNAQLAQEVLVGPEIIAQEGFILAVRVMNDKGEYNQVEDVNGRLIRLRSGDILAGVLGRRRALKGYAGDVPEHIAVGDRLQVLNMGGIIGRCTSRVLEIGEPFDVEVIGAILKIPAGGDRVGVPASIHHGAIQPAQKLVDRPPKIIYVVGTAMNSGKTAVCIEIVRSLSRSGYKVGACKLTGVSLRRDTLGMEDAGAFFACSFNDTGVATTHDHCAVETAKGIVNHLASLSPDVIVAELGDGLLGEYGVADILLDEHLAKAGAAFIICAPDQVAAWGAAQLFKNRFNLPITAFSGPVTDSGVGRDYIQNQLGFPAHNARQSPENLFEVVVREIGERKGEGN